MLDRMWDLFVDGLIVVFMPLVCSYYVVSGSVFLNVSNQNPTKLERIGNILLYPIQYLLAGKEAVQKTDGSWEFTQKFNYSDRFYWIKAGASVITLPPSIVLGSLFKGLSLLSKEGAAHYFSLVEARNSTKTTSYIDLYRKMGIKIEPSTEKFTPLGCQRRPGDENYLGIEKEALADIAKVLNKGGIPWWIDCGTCLGAYRYGGAIPWDGDIDIAVLLPDFQNVRCALNQLDPAKYMVQDWSSRDYPDSFIKVFIRKSGTMVDIYHFAIEEEKRELSYIFSLETHTFFPEWWKIRERRFKEPVSFETVFPLKKGDFDGIEVFIPHNTKKYLQRYYGENLDPAKIYNPQTGLYEKDPAHPYWQRAYVH